MTTVQFYTREDAKKEIERKATASYAVYYIGITDDLEERLGAHKATDSDTIFKGELLKEDCAREVEEYFQDKGMAGFHGGGKGKSKYLYCYKIASHTKEKV